MKLKHIMFLEYQVQFRGNHILFEISERCTTIMPNCCIKKKIFQETAQQNEAQNK